MKRSGIAIFVTCAVLIAAGLVSAREANKEIQAAETNFRIETHGILDLDRPLEEQGLKVSSQADTTVLGFWTFDSGSGCDPQGWTAYDWSAQPGSFFHVDDFAGLGGGSYGLLIPLQGTQSLWCGARPDPSSVVLCNYAALPGYGNGWYQGWCFKCIEVPDTERVIIDYLISWDTEPGYDYVYLEYATSNTCDSLLNVDDIHPSKWNEFLTIDDFGTMQFRSDTIPSGHEGFIKFRFLFLSDGAWSDEDGLWDTDGAVIIDSVTVRAEVSGNYDFEDFEDEIPGDLATTDGDWECCVMSGYGDFSVLYSGNALIQEDPCVRNVSCLWSFIRGSSETYACGGFPDQIAVPKTNTRGQAIQNSIVSPLIPITGVTGSTFMLYFDVYRDLSIPGLIFYTWDVRSWVSDCPGYWRDRGSGVYYGANKDWFRQYQSFGDLIRPGASHIQIALGLVDMCPWWYIIYGDCACHSHAPLFDNIEVVNISITGPQWSVRDIDLFQDTFPENGTSVGTGRIDMALDRAPNASPTIYPGDSATVNCSDPVAGLLEPDPHTGFGGAAYFYLAVVPQDQPGKMTPAEIEEDGFRWPVVDSVFCSGLKWYQFRMDTAFTEPEGPRTGSIPDRFCIDVNDHCFTNGDTLYFFFGAENAVGDKTYYSQGSGTNFDVTAAASSPMEMQILPSDYCNSSTGGSGDILYVDNFSGRGAQPYFESAFEMMGISNYVDRYDKRGPSSCVSNSLGHRCSSVQNQLIPNYNLIIWNSGDLDEGTVGDGTGDPEKADDFAALTLFLSQHTNPSMEGIYFSGDDMAEEWAGPYIGPSATAFINTYIPHTLVTGDHKIQHGLSPYAIGTVGGMFDDPISGVDTVIAYGGCPVLNDFDQIQPTGISTLEMTYSGTGLDQDGAVIAASQLNDLGNPIGVVLSGFSYHYIRDDRPQGIPDRVDHLVNVIRYLISFPSSPTGTDTTPRFTNSLSQNYPNPFNPVTTIQYSIAERSHVSLKVYNVAGQLVKTIVNKEQSPKMDGYTVRWDGRNEAGDPVSSGVYFYRLVSRNFTQTRKMILLR